MDLTPIVLAHELTPSGELSQQSRERIDLARKYFPDSQKIILSGGCIEMYHPHDMGRAMREYALSMGFKPEQIVSEPLSSETVGQLIFTKWGILEPRGIRRVAVISHDWHLPRALAEARAILGKSYYLEGHSAPSETPFELTFGSLTSFLKTFEGVDFESEDQVLDTLLKKHPRYRSSQEGYRAMFQRLKQENLRQGGAP